MVICQSMYVTMSGMKKWKTHDFQGRFPPKILLSTSKFFVFVQMNLITL